MAPRRTPEEPYLYPPNLTPSESEQLLSTIKDWSVAHGLTVRPPLSVVSAEADPHGVLATTAPVTLFPSPFPQVCFDRAKNIQKAYNRLYASIARDEEFLRDIVREYACLVASTLVKSLLSEMTQFWRLRASRLMGSRIIDVDDFIAELWQVHLKVKEEGYVQVESISARKNKLAKNP